MCNGTLRKFISKTYVFPLLNPSSISARRRDLKFERNGLTTAKLYNKLTKEYIRDMIQDTP